jgi:four helix bundle protein
MDYQGLLVWQRAMDLCHEVYRITDAFPEREIFKLTSQIRGSAISVPSNVAGGEGRLTRGERKQFLGHARGSLYEVETQLTIARRVGYSVPEGVFEAVRDVKRLLDGYLAYVQSH